jgi:hypothetical protein
VPVPVAATVNFAVVPGAVVLLYGWVVIFGIIYRVAAFVYTVDPRLSFTTQRNWYPFIPAVAATESVAVLLPLCAEFAQDAVEFFRNCH